MKASLGGAHQLKREPSHQQGEQSREGEKSTSPAASEALWSTERLGSNPKGSNVIKTYFKVLIQHSSVKSSDRKQMDAGRLSKEFNAVI